MKVISYIICGLLLTCLMSCDKEVPVLYDHGCNDLTETVLTRCNPDDETDGTTTITFRMKYKTLYIEISPFEGVENMEVNSTTIHGDYLGLIDIWISPDITDHYSTWYYNLSGRFSRQMKFEKGRQFETDVKLSYFPEYGSVIELDYHLEIGEGETVEWKVDKLCLENVLKQPDE